MKKILFAVLISFIVLSSNALIKVSASGNEIFLISSNNVEVTVAGYEKLIDVGYTHREILNISNEEYSNVMNMNIVYIQNDEYYIKTTTVEDDEGLVTSTDEAISKNQAYNEIKEQENNYGVAPALITPDHMLDNGGDSGGGYAGDQTQNSNATTEYKYLAVTGTFYRNQGNLGTFFIKVNLTWLKTPKKRLLDVISINFSDNVQITSEYINGSQYPEFDSKFIYDERYTKNYVNPTDTPEYIDRVTTIETILDGRNTNNYAYKIDQGLGVYYQLPSDSYSDLSSGSSVLTYNWEYSEFFVTVSANFIPKQTGLNAATFAGTYQHQTGTGQFDWGNVSFSPSPPFFNYSTSFWRNDPTFDDTLARQIFFENLA